MTNGTQAVIDILKDAGQAVEPGALEIIEGIFAQHQRMVDAEAAVRDLRETDPAYAATVDEFDVQRGLWKQAVELGALKLAKDVVTAIAVVVGQRYL